jgi:hypothetical protein
VRTSPPGGENSVVAQTRLKAVLDVKCPYLRLDGAPFPAEEVGVRFVAELIEANGREVSFTAWRKKHSQFEGEQSNRVLDRLPAEILAFIIRGGKGHRPRLDTAKLR